MYTLRDTLSTRETFDALLESELRAGSGKEIIYNCFDDKNRVIVETDLPENSIIYQGHPILSYKCHSNTSNFVILGALSALPNNMIGNLGARMENLYPRTREELASVLQNKFRGLSAELIETMIEQEEHKIIPKIDCNEYSSDGRKYIYLFASKLNHSCNPNCRWNIVNGIITIRTIRPVFRGEELTHSYYPECLIINNVEQRRHIIEKNGRFLCNCDLCTKNIYRDLSLIRISCDNCGSSDVKLFTCTSCKSVNYCSKKCQKTSWKKHKIVCQKTPLDICYCISCVITGLDNMNPITRHPSCQLNI